MVVLASVFLAAGPLSRDQGYSSLLLERVARGASHPLGQTGAGDVPLRR